MTDVVIIGGGLAGLTCAVALADNGLRVTVLERDAQLGGRARSWTDKATGDTVDIGPHIVHSEYRNMLALLQRLGTKELITWQPHKVITLASQPRPVVLRHWPLPPPLSLLPSLLTAPGLSLHDNLSMAPVSWRAMQFGEENIAQLDHLSALDFFRNSGVSEHMIDWWWRFAAMVVTNVPLERCSAASLMRIHAQLSNYRQLHFGFAAVGLADLYLPHAVRIIEAAGGRVLLQNEVKAFLGREKVEGIVLSDGAHLQAQYYVSALPPQELAQLLPAAWKTTPYFNTLASFEPSPYVSCYLWFDREITPERFVSHLWSPIRLNYDFYDLSKIRAGWKSRPSVMASNIIYSHRAHGMSDEEIIQVTIREITEFAPHAAHANIRHACVHRIPMAIPCPTPGMESKRPPAGSSLHGLILAGDWMQTHLPCSMESAVKSGLLSAEYVLADLGWPRQLAQPQRLYDGIACIVRTLTRWNRSASNMP